MLVAALLLADPDRPNPDAAIVWLLALARGGSGWSIARTQGVGELEPRAGQRAPFPVAALTSSRPARTPSDPLRDPRPQGAAPRNQRRFGEHALLQRCQRDKERNTRSTTPRESFPECIRYPGAT